GDHARKRDESTAARDIRGRDEGAAGGGRAAEGTAGPGGAHVRRVDALDRRVPGRPRDRPAAHRRLLPRLARRRRAKPWRPHLAGAAAGPPRPATPAAITAAADALRPSLRPYCGSSESAGHVDRRPVAAAPPAA